MSILRKYLQAIIMLLLAGCTLSLLSFKTNVPTVEVNGNHPLEVDTVYFTPNGAEGWGAYATYFSLEGDSVSMELILNFQSSINKDWNQPKFTGVVLPPYVPVIEQATFFQEPNRNWQFVIKPDGKCFLKFLNGSAPSRNTSVLPLKIKYKK